MLRGSYADSVSVLRVFALQRATLVFVGVVLLLLGALFVALIANDVCRLQRLATEGLPSIGTVVKKSMRRANDQGTTDTSYEVDYVFATVGGRRLEGTGVDPRGGSSSQSLPW
jgi:hypothetical protein